MKIKLFLLTFLISIFSLGQSQKQTKVYTDFLKTQKNISAKDYILGLFKKYDIVIISERSHNEATQYNLITEISNDKYFKRKVGNIMMEIGVSNLEPKMNKFLHTDNLSEKEIENNALYFQRNAPFYAVWEANSYQKFIKDIYRINNNSERKISIYPSDFDFKWENIKNAEDYKKYMITDGNIKKRDSILAFHMMNYFERLPKNKKALFIINYRHAFKENMPYEKGIQDNCANYIFKKYENRVANVMLNTYKTGTNDLIQDGKWDASFKEAGIENLGFNFAGSPFGDDNFDNWFFKNNYKYKDIFTGYVFYKPIEEHKNISFVQNFITPDFQNEFIRRWEITGTLFPNFKKFDFTNEDFVKMFIKEFNTVKEKKYPKIEKQLEQREKAMQ